MSHHSLSLSEKFIRDLEEIYELAMDAGKFSSALKAKEMIAKERQKSMPVRSLKDLTTQELEILIQHMEKTLLTDTNCP